MVYRVGCPVNSDVVLVRDLRQLSASPSASENLCDLLIKRRMRASVSPFQMPILARIPTTESQVM
jgi:hypothetical protein